MFNPGDVVVLNSTNMLHMTVVNATPSCVQVIWLEAKSDGSFHFHQDTLPAAVIHIIDT